jgi:hypothetical protein
MVMVVKLERACKLVVRNGHDGSYVRNDNNDLI